MQIECGRVPKVLLMGNGINRAYDFASWDGLIESIRTKELTDDEKKSMDYVPYPLRPVILSDDHVGSQMKKISGSLSALRASDEEEKLLKRYAELSVDAILTTNYTYELEKAVIPEFKCVAGRRCKWRKATYENGGKYCKEQLYTYFDMGKACPSIWHIHGEAARPDTTVLGHYYYGKHLAKMQSDMPHIIARYKASLSKHFDMRVYSWLEYFMISDVYIVGCGMALTELDLWWLVNCKKRHFPDRKVILYKPDIRTEEQLLAESYDVIVEKEGFEQDYKKYYELVCTNLMSSSENVSKYKTYMH